MGMTFPVFRWLRFLAETCRSDRAYTGADHRSKLTSKTLMRTVTDGALRIIFDT
jgi:hypothetical protein